METLNIKINYLIYIFLVYFCSLLIIPSLFAETGYVSDMLILSLKEGPGRQYNTIKTLRSNTPVEIIETTDRFLKVKTEEGDLGWVENQYITHEIPKAIIIEQLKEKISLLERKNPSNENMFSENVSNQGVKNDLNQVVGNIQNENETDKQIAEKLKSLEVALKLELEKNRELEAQLSNAKTGQNKNSISKEANKSIIDKNNLNTNKEGNISKSNINKSNIKEENIQEKNIQEQGNLDEKSGSSILSGKSNVIVTDDILKTAMIKWFCAGAGVLIAGWFIGRSFSGVRRRRGLLD